MNMFKKIHYYDYMRLYHDGGFIELWIVSDILPVQIVKKYLDKSYIVLNGVLDEKNCFLFCPETYIDGVNRKKSK